MAIEITKKMKRRGESIRKQIFNKLVLRAAVMFSEAFHVVGHVHLYFIRAL